MVEAFSRGVRQLFPDASVWAFGSRVRGDAEIDSDFDLCVLLDVVTPERKVAIRDIAWEISFENEVILNTFIIPRWQFERGPLSASTLVENILREGIPA